MFSLYMHMHIEELLHGHPPAVSGQPASDLVISGDLMKSGQAHSEMGKT
jgi:hypothetical protein